MGASLQVKLDGLRPLKRAALHARSREQLVAQQRQTAPVRGGNAADLHGSHPFIKADGVRISFDVQLAEACRAGDLAEVGEQLSPDPSADQIWAHPQVR